MFRNYLKSGKSRPVYDVVVTELTDDNKNIVADLVFKKNESYCCGEATCHFKPDWFRIREIAVSKGLELSSPLSIRLNVIIEYGALINTNKAIGLPLKSNEQRYTQNFSEQT